MALSARNGPPWKVRCLPYTDNEHSSPPAPDPDPRDPSKLDRAAGTEGTISNNAASEAKGEDESQENQDEWYEAEQLLRVIISKAPNLGENDMSQIFMKLWVYFAYVQLCIKWIPFFSQHVRFHGNQDFLSLA